MLPSAQNKTLVYFKALISTQYIVNMYISMSKIYNMHQMVTTRAVTSGTKGGDGSRGSRL